MARPAALVYLAWRALVAHPLRKVFRTRRKGLDLFLSQYGSEGLVVTHPDEREAMAEAGRCISCGLCELSCDLTQSSQAVRALGLPAVFRLYSRNLSEMPLAAEALNACSRCGACDALCPTQVPISALVARLRQMAERQPRGRIHEP